MKDLGWDFFLWSTIDSNTFLTSNGFSLLSTLNNHVTLELRKTEHDISYELASRSIVHNPKV